MAALEEDIDITHIHARHRDVRDQDAAVAAHAGMASGHLREVPQRADQGAQLPEPRGHDVADAR